MVLKLQIGSYEIPLKLSPRVTSTVRFSIKSGKVTITYPNYFTNQMVLEQTLKCKNWLNKLLESKPHLFIQKNIQFIPNHSIIVLIGIIYQIDIQFISKSSKVKAVKNGDLLQFTLPEELKCDVNKHNQIIVKCLSKLFLKTVQNLVINLNEKYSKATLKQISLKNTSSRWGSCTHDAKIMLSTRLLFHPQHILEHVILHELAHTIVKNHSKQFWQTLASFDPNWKENNQYLKQNGQLSFF